MAGWTTIDDFESGSLSADWNGDTASFEVIEDSTIEGDYNLHAIMEGATKIIYNDSKTISRNSNSHSTLRALFNVSNQIKTLGTPGASLIFFYEDTNNYYYIQLSYTSQYGADMSVTLYKVVEGVETELASQVYTSTTIQGIELKAETSLITITTYTDLAFSTAEDDTVTSNDTSMTSGYSGFRFQSPGSGTDWYYYFDYLQYYVAATGTNMKINIGDTFKDVSEMKINIGDSWKDVSEVKINIGDSWKTVFS